MPYGKPCNGNRGLGRCDFRNIYFDLSFMPLSCSRDCGIEKNPHRINVNMVGIYLSASLVGKDENAVNESMATSSGYNYTRITFIREEMCRQCDKYFCNMSQEAMESKLSEYEDFVMEEYNRTNKGQRW